jgi:hypothetical protein
MTAGVNLAKAGQLVAAAQTEQNIDASAESKRPALAALLS